MTTLHTIHRLRTACAVLAGRAAPGLAKRLVMGVATVAAIGAALSPAAACAFDFNGDKRLLAVFRDGSTQPLGTVSVAPAPQAPEVTFKVKLDSAVLQDFFLSMREFKCLPAAAEVTCVVPYPYPQPGKVTPTDLRWLEHNLLFLFKQPADFGAKLWNGVIFKFTETPTALVGRPQAVDLNAISAPPERPQGRAPEPPYTDMDRTDIPAGARWVAELRIE